MMVDLFEMKVQLNGQQMLEFGDFIKAICIDFPMSVDAQAVALLSLCDGEKPDLDAMRLALAILASNARNAVMVGDAIANLIGKSTPVRIDGGPLQ